MQLQGSDLPGQFQDHTTSDTSVCTCKIKNKKEIKMNRCRFFPVGFNMNSNTQQLMKQRFCFGFFIFVKLLQAWKRISSKDFPGNLHPYKSIKKGSCKNRNSMIIILNHVRIKRGQSCSYFRNKSFCPFTIKDCSCPSLLLLV